MLLKPFGINAYYLDETEGDGEGGGGAADRGDDFEADDEEVVDKKEDEEEDEAAADDEESKDDEEKSDDDEESGDDKKKPEKKDEKKKVEEKKPAKMVPHARMKEAVEKERRAREAAEKARDDAQAKVKEASRGVDLDKLNTEIEELEEKIDAATADNKPEEKRALRKQLRDKMQTLARAEAAALSAQATAIAVERVRYDALVERLEVEHPVMNPDHEDYDEDVVAEIVDLKEAYEAKGMSSSDALKKATKYVVKQAPAKEEKEEEKEDDEQVEERREKTIKQNQKVKAKQPPSADKGGKASDKSGGGMAKNIEKLSDDEFDKLDPKELARLRGD